MDKLPGFLPAVLITAGLLTLIVSALLLWLYRRATIKQMNQQVTPTQASKINPDKVHLHKQVELNIEIVNDDTNLQSPAETHDWYRRAVLSSQRTAMAYILGALVYALIMSCTWMYLADGFSVGRFIWLFAVYLWPAVITLNLMLAVSTRDLILYTLAYTLIVMIALVVVGIRNDNIDIIQLTGFWLIANFGASVLFVAFLNQRIRSVGPLVFTIMIAGVAGAFALILYLSENDAALYSIASAGIALGLGARTIFILLHIAGFLCLALVAWQVLKRVGINYQRRKTSDQSITLDSMWLMFAIVQTMSFVFEGAIWLLTGLVAYAGYKLTSSVALSIAAKSANPERRPAKLLLLRVFSLGRISNRFFYRFSKYWRHAGTVNMIAGPDLVTLSVEPHEFLAFMGGYHARRFIKSADEVKVRLNKLDDTADVDQRYRVNEFFCHDDTWRETLQQLAADSDAVLMDLRSFSDANKGCLYELKVLVNTVDLQRVIFLVDDTTDKNFLETSLKALCQAIAQNSPNASGHGVTAVLFQTNKPTRKSIEKLMLLLLTSRMFGERQMQGNAL